jgi:hypothetical protein
MFTGPTVGTVIAVPHANAVWKVGYQTDSWINHDDDSSWEDMKPSDEFFKMVSRQLFELPSDVPSIFD